MWVGPDRINSLSNASRSGDLVFDGLSLGWNSLTQKSLTNTMENFLIPPKRLELLLVRDIDINSTSRLAEHFIQQNPKFDAVLACGPLFHGSTSTPEELAVAHGDIATTLGHLENIVCRVLYLPSESDPQTLLKDQLYLTANSLSLYGRQVTLMNNLYTIGLTEISDHKVLRDGDDSEEGVQVSTNVSTSVLRELLANVGQSQTGILALNYHYAHTLNQILFHMKEDFESVGLDFLIISSSGPGEETSRLPKKIGKLSIAAPKSLRAGYYTEISLEFQDNAGLWKVVRNETLQLPNSVSK